MFIQNIFEIYSRVIGTSDIFYKSGNRSINDISKNISSSHKIHLFSVLTRNNKTKFFSNIEDFANKELISRNFVAKLINQYWQETIFLSVSNPITDSYIDKLKSSGLSVYNNQYRKFLIDFSKALYIGRVEASINSTKSISNAESDSKYLKYIWRKGLNFTLPRNFFINFSRHNIIFMPKQVNLDLMQQLNKNELPLFTVINKFNQIIMAEPAEEVEGKANWVDRMYQWYYYNFLSTCDSRPVYEGLFFMNSEDAEEYKNYIQQKYKSSGRQNHLKVFASKLDFYYELSRNPMPQVKFRLIPDLTELGNLIFRYKKFKHIYFHSKQNHGKNYFQGQPIYLIQPTFAFDIVQKKIVPVRYSYVFKNSNQQKEYEAIFMNYETAIIAWKKFRQHFKNYKLPIHPKITVYNLEDFLKTCEGNRQISSRNLLFVPSKNSYEFVKNNVLHSFQLNMSKIFSSKLLYLQILSKRIIWSLTSRQPNNW
uniref:Uncharacterized protein n=1 Tax=Sebdenia flabellata TaxID=42024 RepID=A0A1C9C9U9_9FLOR|nr:hypothetical protein Sebd_075 [Sebdenia flabellata]AOM65162.1 hypothetical protein Sebd_075 [Sebdenia flabellata]